MAGEIKQGFPENNEEPDSKAAHKPILVETAAFTAETIGLYDMPGELVLDMLSTPGMEQMPKLVHLFKLSVNDPKKADDISILSFIELTMAVRLWVAKSSELMMAAHAEDGSTMFNLFVNPNEQ